MSTTMNSDILNYNTTNEVHKDLLDFYVKLKERVEEAVVAELVRNVVTSEDTVGIYHLVILAFHIRVITGKPDIFRSIIKYLPSVIVEAILPGIPDYGSWSDLVKDVELFTRFESIILSLVAAQWDDDVRTYYINSSGDTKWQNVSALGLHLPREHSSFPRPITKKIAKKVTGKNKGFLPEYRKMCQDLKKDYNISESTRTQSYLSNYKTEFAEVSEKHKGDDLRILSFILNNKVFAYAHALLNKVHWLVIDYSMPPPPLALNSRERVIEEEDDGQRTPCLI